MRRALALAVLVLAGCYQSSSLGHDAGPRIDTGPLDSGIPPGSCDVIAGYRICDPRCEDRCPPGSACAEDFGFCLSGPPNGCSFLEGSGSHEYCPAGGFCALRSSPAARHGPCFTAELCREVAQTEAPVCIYSDRTPFVEGPPQVETCPGAPGGGPGALCGGPCGECTSIRSGVGCTGLSDRRESGLCIVGGSCSRDALSRDDYCFQPLIPGEEPDDVTRCGCLVFRVDGDELETGWRVFETSCRAYRELYGDQVECYTLDTWDVL